MERKLLKFRKKTQIPLLSHPSRSATTKYGSRPKLLEFRIDFGHDDVITSSQMHHMNVRGFFSDTVVRRPKSKAPSRPSRVQ